MQAESGLQTDTPYTCKAVCVVAVRSDLQNLDRYLYRGFQLDQNSRGNIIYSVSLTNWMPRETVHCSMLKLFDMLQCNIPPGTQSRTGMLCFQRVERFKARSCDMNSGC